MRSIAPAQELRESSSLEKCNIQKDKVMILFEKEKFAFITEVGYCLKCKVFSKKKFLLSLLRIYWLRMICQAHAQLILLLTKGLFPYPEHSGTRWTLVFSYTVPQLRSKRSSGLGWNGWIALPNWVEIMFQCDPNLLIKFSVLNKWNLPPSLNFFSLGTLDIGSDRSGFHSISYHPVPQ